MERTKQNRLSNAGIFTLMFAATFTVMVGSLITPALPAIARGLGFAAGTGWLVTLPALGVVVSAPIAGRIIDRVGARRSMIVGLALYGALGECVVFLGFSRVAVLADRLLLGAATALVMAAGTTLIAEFFDGPQRLKMIAWQGMAIEAGGVVFLALGGVLGGWGWKMPFLLYLLAWVCLLCVFFLVPKPVSFVEEESAAPGDSPSLFPVFLNAFLAMTIFFVAYTTLPAALSSRFKMTEAAVGYFMAFISFMAVIFAGCLPRIMRAVPAKLLMSLSFAFFGFGELLFAHAGNMTGMVLGAVATGAGFGFSIPTANHLVVDQSSPGSRGRNLSYLAMAIFLGQFASTFVTFGHSSAQQALSAAGFLSLGVASAGLLYFGTNWLSSREIPAVVQES